jgi:16S rRNA (guanine966-N2)-methyltransferase
MKQKTSGSGSGRGAQARQLRIIAGVWRGRRWRFPPGPIRPTGDRVRETLFNWLQGRISGRRCLDLYAGAGALGLEALSRGAAHCVFVDSDRQAIEQLRRLLLEWHADPAAAQCLQAEAARYLAGPPQPCDVVFLDPPFAAGALAATISRLESRGWLRSGAHIYIEHPRSVPLENLPANWRALRSGTAGAVGYDLIERL